MLVDKNDSQTYIRDFQKRFNNFAEKAPLRLSYSISPQGISVIEETKPDVVYQFDWDFTEPVKSFIHGIKEVLSQKLYPRIVQILEEEKPVSEEEAAYLIAKGTPVDDVPSVKIEQTIIPYMIDKVIVFKDVFILKNLDTGELFRYKLNKSSVFFLKKIRSGLSQEQAGDYFFKNAVLLNKIENKEEYGSQG